MSQVANENPLDSGNDASSVESAAADFTRMLNAEVPSRRSEAGKSSDRRSEPKEDEEDASTSEDGSDADTEGDGQSPSPERDDILGEPSEEDAENDDDAEDDEEADDKSDEEADEDDGEIDWDREVEINVAGEAKSLKLSEIVQGYQRDADYRQKTAALAEERDEVVAYAQETVAERKHYAETIGDFVSLAEALRPSDEEWNALKTSNPQAFIAMRDQWDAIGKKLEAAKTEQAAIQERETADAIRQHKDWVKSENEKLFKAVPNLANPKMATQFRDLIFGYGRAAGYTDDEIKAGLVDHRDVITAYKAARYDEIMASRKASQGRQKGENKAPKHSQSSQPRSLGKRANANSNGQRNADRRLARSGSQEDAAMSFTEMLRS